MSNAAVRPARQSLDDPHKLGRPSNPEIESTGSGQSGPASKRIVVGFGFWIFLLSDIIMFAAIFATYSVLEVATNGGPTGADLFHLDNVKIETALLLLSSFSCGLAMISSKSRHVLLTQVFLIATGILGLCFLAMEFSEFNGMIQEGAGPQRSAFLSAFFTLVGCHGLHVTLGLVWLLTMMAQIWSQGFTKSIQRRLLCFSLFWHALDIIWVALLTIVYLLGVG
ncbi:cytochrome o ubiquinol oxidase subunit III [Sphingomonas sp. NFX23]|uniref:cytochrome o ubiquinol oxidase subunit III n=1 Tax=Sphingomonas sp. NFX23 TaxID=2819532 RepID=UPI003CE878F7